MTTPTKPYTGMRVSVAEFLELELPAQRARCGQSMTSTAGAHEHHRNGAHRGRHQVLITVRSGNGVSSGAERCGCSVECSGVSCQHCDVFRLELAAFTWRHGLGR